MLTVQVQPSSLLESPLSSSIVANTPGEPCQSTLCSTLIVCSACAYPAAPCSASERTCILLSAPRRYRSHAFPASLDMPDTPGTLHKLRQSSMSSQCLLVYLPSTRTFTNPNRRRYGIQMPVCTAPGLLENNAPLFSATCTSHFH